MEIRVLQYFLAVAQEESISRAAEALHITQPTLSRQMAQLEEETGVRLFYRGARKITLTGEGLLLRRRAEEILSLVDRTGQELGEQEKQIEGRVVIGCGELAAVGILAEAIASFHEKYPRVSFDLVTETADRTREQMEKGLEDIGILLEPIDMERYDFIRLERAERWGILMRAGDPLAKAEAVGAADLAGRPLILPGRANVRNELANWFGAALKEEQILFTGNLSTNSAVMVERGLACAVVIEGSLPFLDQEKLVLRPLNPPLCANSTFAWKRQQPFSPAAARFIEHLQERCRE